MWLQKISPVSFSSTIFPPYWAFVLHTNKCYPLYKTKQYKTNLSDSVFSSSYHSTSLLPLTMNSLKKQGMSLFPISNGLFSLFLKLPPVRVCRLPPHHSTNTCPDPGHRRLHKSNSQVSTMAFELVTPPRSYLAAKITHLPGFSPTLLDPFC